MTDPVVMSLANVSKTYRLGTEDVGVHDMSLDIERGSFVSITGPSGSGKSTILHLLGLLDQPDSGSVRVSGWDCSQLSGPQRAWIRASQLGFVFQSFHLLEARSVIDNVATGLDFGGFDRSEWRQEAAFAIQQVGLDGRQSQRVATLSGGERQRVAIARALVRRPSVILADEPTGNLDRSNSEMIVDVLRTLHSDGTTVVVVTHDAEIAATADVRLRVFDGHLDESPR